MRNPDHTETITNEILADLSLREKNIIANMDEHFVECLTCQFSRYFSEKAPRSDYKERVEIVKEVWRKLSRSHRLKVVD